MMFSIESGCVDLGASVMIGLPDWLRAPVAGNDTGVSPLFALDTAVCVLLIVGASAARGVASVSAWVAATRLL